MPTVKSARAAVKSVAAVESIVAPSAVMSTANDETAAIRIGIPVVERIGITESVRIIRAAVIVVVMVMMLMFGLGYGRAGKQGQPC